MVRIISRIMWTVVGSEKGGQEGSRAPMHRPAVSRSMVKIGAD